MAGMDSWNKHFEQISFRQCITFCKHRQLKGWQPHFQPTVAKSSISTSVRWFAAVSQHNWEHNHNISKHLGDHNCVTKRFASLHETGAFFWSCNEGMGMMQAYCRIGGAYCPSQGTSSFWSGVDAWHFPKEWQEWTPETNTSNHVEHVSFRQCITFKEHRQLKAGSPASKQPLLKVQSMTMTMPYTQVENSRPGWERFWAYDFNLTCFPNAFPASSKYTTVISSGLRNSSSWRLNWNYTWTTCSKAGSSAWNSKKERQEWMS